MTWRGRNLYLVGMPGAGKTSIGAALAALLARHHYHFIDLDQLIEVRTGKDPQTLFAEGEEVFRRVETEALLEVAELSSATPAIVATGGGSVVRSINRTIMRGSGLMIYIDVSVNQAAQFVMKGILEGTPRPLLRASTPQELTDKLRALNAERSRYYEQATLHFVAKNPKGATRSPEELAVELLNALEEMSRRVRLKPRFKTLRARSSTRSYPISIGSGIAANELAYVLSDDGIETAVMVTDSTVAKLHGQKLSQRLATTNRASKIYQILIEPGEQEKSVDTLFEILDFFASLKLSRKSSAVIALGGGVVTDLAGLASNLYHRGIPVIHVPTTLLGQVDAAVGGKTAINYGGQKNNIGSFYQPQSVIVDPTFLATLPKRQLHSGLAEVLKYGLIGSPGLWVTVSKAIRRLLRGVDPTYEPIIRAAIAEKLRYVESDEFEARSGIRELLNFGHTFGHALEAATEFNVLLHGEAVALGMRAAAWLSKEEGLLSEPEWHEVELTVGRIPIVPTLSVSAEKIYKAMGEDKKRVSGQQRLVLLESIGKASVVTNVREQSVKKAIEFMLTLA